MPDPQPERITTTLTVVRQSARLMGDELVMRLHAAGYNDITASHQAVFENIDRDGTRLTILAARSGITHQSMSELVQMLERAGYLERQPDPADGRARIIRLTDKGRSFAARSRKSTRSTPPGESNFKPPATTSTSKQCYSQPSMRSPGNIRRPLRRRATDSRSAKPGDVPDGENQRGP